MTNDELKVLQELRSDLFYQIEAKFGSEKASNYHSIVRADKLIKNNDVVSDDGDWVSINDELNPIPNYRKIQIKFEGGSVIDYDKKDWPWDEVTHWRIKS